MSLPSKRNSLKKTIEKRKLAHLQAMPRPHANFKNKTPLFEEVELIHQALPELSLEEIDLSTSFLGKTLKVPLLIAGMTGGLAQATAINRDLAEIAETLGLGFGVGSQRPMLIEPTLSASYQVRDVAPSIPLFGNLSLVQAAALSTIEIQRLISTIEADALCLHLNPAMELIQEEGDRDFRFGYKTISRLLKELPYPLVIKETGCGLSREVGENLSKLGVSIVDVGGAGGTSFVSIESHRLLEQKKTLPSWANDLQEWGIPTAASLSYLTHLPLFVIATGGIKTALDAAKAIALGADAVGMAGQVIQTYLTQGKQATFQLLTEWIESLRRIFLLCGCKSIAQLQSSPIVIGPILKTWISTYENKPF